MVIYVDQQRQVNLHVRRQVRVGVRRLQHRRPPQSSPAYQLPQQLEEAGRDLEGEDLWVSPFVWCVCVCVFGD